MKKRFIAILSLFTILLVGMPCDSLVPDMYIAPREGIRIYDTDYIKVYKDTLNVMFDNEWTLVSMENKYEEHDEVCEHVDTRPQQFVEWKIEYRDGNGDIQLFVFDNRYRLSSYIQNYITSYISDYYQENYYNIYMKGIPLARSSDLSCFFVDNFAYTSYEDVKDMMETSQTFVQNLDTPEGAICLTKLTPANVFEMCPIYLSISVSLRGSSTRTKKFERGVIQQIEGMIEDINVFTNNHLTARVHFGYHEGMELHMGYTDYWMYVQGKQIFDVEAIYFSRHVFDGYKGIFW